MLISSGSIELGWMMFSYDHCRIAMSSGCCTIGSLQFHISMSDGFCELRTE